MSATCLLCHKSATLVELSCQHIICSKCITERNGSHVRCPLNSCRKSTNLLWMYAGIRSGIWRPYTSVQYVLIERHYHQTFGLGYYVISIAGAHRLIDYQNMVQINLDTFTYRKIIRFSPSVIVDH